MPASSTPRASAIITSPPSLRKITLKMVAPIITNMIIAVVRVVSFSTERNCFQVSWREASASRKAPKAPSAAASVGVAMPAMIEPSTTRIRIIGAIRSRASRVAAWPRGRRSRAGSGGMVSGLKIARNTR